MSNFRENKYINSLIKYIVATVKGLTVFGLGASLIAVIMCKFDTKTNILYFFGYIFILLGAFVCGVSSYRKIGGRGFLTGIKGSLLYGVAIMLILCLITTFNITISILFVMLIAIAGGFLGGITAVNTKI